MAFDGIVVSNIVQELNHKLINARITKIAQPEKDELIITFKSQDRATHKLLISASAGLPLLYFTTASKVSPLTAPNFCMLLRKYINNAKVIDIYQPGLERIVNIKLEHTDELGDLCTKFLIIELMGKHSNIIFCDDEFNIIDSIKRVNHFISSVREVLPGKKYFIPYTSEKLDPLNLDFDKFNTALQNMNVPIQKFIYTSFIGISPFISNEIISRASLDSSTLTNELDSTSTFHLFKTMERLLDDVKNKNFSPHIISKNNEPIEFSSLLLIIYKNYDMIHYQSVSEMLEKYYAQKNALTRIRQKSTDLRKILNTAIERTSKKYDLQLKQLKDTENREKFKIYGELITTYGYDLEPNAKELKAFNYYDNTEITIPLKTDLSPIENAKRYFEKYSKQKRTYDALTKYIEETKAELSHLNSIQNSMDIILNEEDLTALREELIDHGYIKKKYSSQEIKQGKKKKTNLPKSKPLHFISSDNYDIYVGKNNYQNEELTFKFANGGDWWFHSKNIAGSHVIVKANGEDLPNQTLEEAAKLAAYYSSGRETGKVEIDYTLKKHLKKPAGAKPGFVIYHVYSSLLASTDISDIKIIED